MTALQMHNDKPVISHKYIPDPSVMYDVWADFEQNFKNWDEVYENFVSWLEWNICGIMEEQTSIHPKNIPDILTTDGAGIKQPDFYVQHSDGSLDEFDLRVYLP